MNEGFSYGFYKSLKNCFVGSVIKITTNNERYENEYTFRIISVYKGHFDSTVIVNSRIDGSSCGATFDLHKTYLIDAYFDYKSRHYSTSACNLNALKGTSQFSKDTLFLNAFSKKEGFVNLPNLKGQLKKGKPTGFWLVNGESGTYKNGKVDGLWKDAYGTETYYKKGKFIKTIDYIFNESGQDSSKVIIGNGIEKFFYPNGKLHKIRKRKVLLIYYPDGQLKHKMNINKHGFIYGYTYRYDEKGKVLEKKFVENDNSEEADYHFLVTE